MSGMAVLDVGKTNAKLVAFSRDGEILEQLRHPQRVVVVDGLRVLDVDGIFGWLETALAALRGRHDLAGLMVSTHGCSCALLAEDKTLAAPIFDYEHEIPAEANAAFARLAPPFSETYSPDLPGGLNMARAIFFQEWADPTLANRVRHILTYPQYWSWRLSGALASEVSFLGCHSQMWNSARRAVQRARRQPRLGEKSFRRSRLPARSSASATGSASTTASTTATPPSITTRASASPASR